MAHDNGVRRRLNLRDHLPAHLLHLALKSLQTTDPSGELGKLLNLIDNKEERAFNHVESKYRLGETAEVDVARKIRDSHDHVREKITCIVG